MEHLKYSLNRGGTEKHGGKDDAGEREAATCKMDGWMDEPGHMSGNPQAIQAVPSPSFFFLPSSLPSS